MFGSLMYGWLGEHNPRACGHCLPLEECNMPTLDGSVLGADLVAAALHSADTPVLVVNASALWDAEAGLGREDDRLQPHAACREDAAASCAMLAASGACSYASVKMLCQASCGTCGGTMSSPQPTTTSRGLEHLVAESGEVQVTVINGGGVGRSSIMRLRDYVPAIRNGSIPHSAHIFSDVNTTTIAEAWPELGNFYATVTMRTDVLYTSVPHSARGRMMLSMGSWGSGRPFHSHGPTLFGLIAGRKRWVVRRPNASAGWQAFEIRRKGAAAGLPEGWQESLWSCTQKAGELLWIPNQLPHATINHAEQTAGILSYLELGVRHSDSACCASPAPLHLPPRPQKNHHHRVHTHTGILTPSQAIPPCAHEYPTPTPMYSNGSLIRCTMLRGLEIPMACGISCSAVPTSKRAPATAPPRCTTLAMPARTTWSICSSRPVRPSRHASRRAPPCASTQAARRYTLRLPVVTHPSFARC